MDSQTETANRQPGRQGRQGRQGRRWRFGTAVLDERSWTLSVNGHEVPIEAKPMELLHVLVLRAGETVSKDELLAAVWPGVSVVEASLATAMRKVRRALGEDGAAAILTVPRIGYKLAVPVEQESAAAPVAPLPGPPPAAAPPSGSASHAGGKPPWRWRLAAAVLLATGAAGAVWFSSRHTVAATASVATPVDLGTARDALRRLDVRTIESLLRAGWDPNTPFDSEGNAALETVVQICEWHPAHDRQQLQVTVKTLLDAGARPVRRNVWGDTAYSIARAERFCGPEHPVVHLLHVACYTGPAPPGDQCQADYAHARGIGQDGRARSGRPP